MHRLSRYIVNEVCAGADYVPVPMLRSGRPLSAKIIAPSRTCFIFSSNDAELLSALPLVHLSSSEACHRLAVAPHTSLG